MVSCSVTAVAFIFILKGRASPKKKGRASLKKKGRASPRATLKSVTECKYDLFYLNDVT